MTSVVPDACFLACFAAFFSFGVDPGFFFASLLLFLILPMVSIPIMSLPDGCCGTGAAKLAAYRRRISDEPNRTRIPCSTDLDRCERPERAWAVTSPGFVS